jgi:hypothetical protein
MHFFHDKGFALIFSKKWLGLHFGATFSETHLVTLARQRTDE